MKFRHKKRFKIQDLDFTLLTHKPAKFLFHVLLQQYQVETTSYTCNYTLLFTCSFVYQVTEFSQDYIFSCLSSSSVSPTLLLGGMTNINKSKVVTFLRNQFRYIMQTVVSTTLHYYGSRNLVVSKCLKKQKKPSNIYNDLYPTLFAYTYYSRQTVILDVQE